MKVLFITSALTHYYNLVLSKLNSHPDVELIAIVPDKPSSLVGAGVYQTRDGINFKVIELKEVRRLGFFTSFKGLASVLSREKPDAIIISEDHLRAFLFEFPIVVARKIVGSKLILKSIPFRYINYNDAFENIKKNEGYASLSPGLNYILRKTCLLSVLRRFMVFIQRKAIQLPDAHVNYVEAYRYWESYGVSKDKIFITRNSPDTDMLFDIKALLSDEPSDIPHNPYRLIHVGRLVKWKRVGMLIRAFARVRERFPSAELVIVGDGPEMEELKSLSQDLLLNDSVRFAGGVYDSKELARYLMASSLYVLAGMGGLSINEAMCFNLPILCSVCDGTEKFLVREGQNGLYFKEGDENELAQKIIWCFSHPDESYQMGRTSEQIIRNEVNIQTVIDGYLRALRFVAEKTRSKYASE